MSAMNGRTVEAAINYQGEMQGRPAYYATDYSRDRLALEAKTVSIQDQRGSKDKISLDKEGFTLVDHRTTLQQFSDADDVSRVYLPEMEQLLLSLTGASQVLMSPSGVLRFSEKSTDYGSQMNTRPARFVHVDYTHRAIPVLLDPLLQSMGMEQPPGRRYAGFNLWRVLSEPPQDVPLCVCDMSSISRQDLVEADAIFDSDGEDLFKFEGYLFHYNPEHRWSWFSDMTRDEVLVFKSYDSRPDTLQCVPHVAFTDPDCPADAPPRASIEVRGFAFFDE